jgi:hypothetical protein
MPLIKFERKVVEGRYLLMTSGPVTWFPGDIAGVSGKLLKELEGTFREKGIRYRHVDRTELNREVENWRKRKNRRP